MNAHDLCACRLRPKTKPLPTVSLNGHCDACSSTVLHCYYLDCMVGNGGGQQLHVNCTEDELASVLERALVMLYPTTVNTNTNISLAIYDATVLTHSQSIFDVLMLVLSVYIKLWCMIIIWCMF